jgi:hypothetical protein
LLLEQPAKTTALAVMTTAAVVNVRFRTEIASYEGLLGADHRPPFAGR